MADGAAGGAKLYPDCNITPLARVIEAMARNKQEDFKSKLLRDYAAATKHYAWAVGELDRQRAVLPVVHYKEMYWVAEDARTACEQLRKAISDLGEEID
jgi:hypothetical protein